LASWWSESAWNTSWSDLPLYSYMVCTWRFSLSSWTSFTSSSEDESLAAGDDGRNRLETRVALAYDFTWYARDGFPCRVKLRLRVNFSFQDSGASGVLRYGKV
jgi:hypothetical protein